MSQVRLLRQSTSYEEHKIIACLKILLSILLLLFIYFIVAVAVRDGHHHVQERGVWPERAARYDAGPANPAREQIQVRYRYTGEYTDNNWHDPYGSALRSRGFFC